MSGDSVHQLPSTDSLDYLLVDLRPVGQAKRVWDRPKFTYDEKDEPFDVLFACTDAEPDFQDCVVPDGAVPLQPGERVWIVEEPGENTEVNKGWVKVKREGAPVSETHLFPRKFLVGDYAYFDLQEGEKNIKIIKVLNNGWTVIQKGNDIGRVPTMDLDIIY